MLSHVYKSKIVVCSIFCLLLFMLSCEDDPSIYIKARPLKYPLNCAFLINADKGFHITLNWMIMTDDERNYVEAYQKTIGANILPFVICNNDPKNLTTPFKEGWGGEINTDLMDGIFKGRLWDCREHNIWYMPCLFLSDRFSKDFSTAQDWHEDYIKYVVGECLANDVLYLLTHWEAEKFVTPAEVNRIAALIRRYSNGQIQVGVHATTLNFARCDVDFVAIQGSWDPWNGKSISPSEMTETLDAWVNAGATKIHFMEYNVYSESEEAKIQGQTALKHPNCIGVGNGWK